MNKKAIPGKAYPGVKCRKCENPIAFFGLVPESGDDQMEPLDPGDLPDRIRAKCPNCGHEASYQRSEIRSLLAHRKQ